MPEPPASVTLGCGDGVRAAEGVRVGGGERVREGRAEKERLLDELALSERVMEAQPEALEEGVAV